jgi:chemotaxis protein MotB
MRAFARSITCQMTVVLAAASLTACASKSSYDTAVSRGDSLQADNVQLQAANARLQAQYDSLQNLFAAEVQAASLDMELLRDGIEIQLPSDLVFESASLQLKADGRAFGTKLVNYLKGNQNLVYVTGYTDSQNPIGTLAQKYPTNWELSAARAALAVRYMVGEGLEASRMWAIGRSDNDPVASNSTADGRAKNRRLRIVLRPQELVGSAP